MASSANEGVRWWYHFILVVAIVGMIVTGLVSAFHSDAATVQLWCWAVVLPLFFLGFGMSIYIQRKQIERGPRPGKLPRRLNTRCRSCRVPKTRRGGDQTERDL